MGQQRKAPQPAEHAPAREASPQLAEHGFELGNDAARAALAHGGDPDDDAPARRAALTHARLALQIHPAPPEDLRRWLAIVRSSGLPPERRAALAARLNADALRAEAVREAVIAAAGADDDAARAALSDALGAAIARLDDGNPGESGPLGPLCAALASIRFDEGDEEALLADQVAEEQV